MHICSYVPYISVLVDEFCVRNCCAIFACQNLTHRNWFRCGNFRILTMTSLKVTSRFLGIGHGIKIDLIMISRFLGTTFLRIITLNPACENNFAFINSEQPTLSKLNLVLNIITSTLQV